jgi:hypothetical protein
MKLDPNLSPYTKTIQIDWRSKIMQLLEEHIREMLQDIEMGKDS